MVRSLPPQLSVIVVVFSDSENFRLSLKQLRAQTILNRLELIIVTPSEKGLNLDLNPLKGYSNYRILEIGQFESEGSAKAMGVMSARSPLIAFIEDHSYPEPGWAELLIKAHDKGNFAAVGPVMVNANPQSGPSWGCFLVYYGQWMSARPQEGVKHLPANQSCYKRDLLLKYGSRLSEMLETESVLHWDLFSKGYRLYQEPAAKVHHLNFSLFGPMLSEYYLASHVFAAQRAMGWSPFKKIMYAFGSPLLPLIRLRRILRDASRGGMEVKVILRAMMAIVFLLCAGSVGETLGYAFGVGKSTKNLARFKANHHLFFTHRDLEAVSNLIKGGGNQGQETKGVL